MMVRRLGWLLVLPACLDSNATIDELPDRRVYVQLSAASDRGPTSGTVLLLYDVDAFRTVHRECATIGSFTGSLTNASITNVSHGGSGNDIMNEGNCLAPSFDFEGHFSADAATTLVISDDSRTITAEFSAETFAPQVPTLRSAADWKFAPGEQVAIGWPHPEDLAIGEQSALVDFNFDSGANGFTLLPTFVGDEIHLTAPDPPLRTGTGTVQIQFGFSLDSATSCTGARCECYVEHGYRHSAELTK